MKENKYNLFISVILITLFSTSSCKFINCDSANSIDSNKKISYDTIAPNSYQHVIVIGVDGMGSYNKNIKCPFFNKYFDASSETFEGVSESPTISAQNWASILMGVSPTVHGLTNDIIESTPINPNCEFPSVFSYISKKFPASNLACFCGWKPIYCGIVDQTIEIEYKTGQDDFLCDEAQEYISSNKPKFMFIQFELVDYMGHNFGWGSDEYYNQIKKEDNYISKIYQSLVDSEIIDSTLFIVTSDHGGIGYSHGGESRQEKCVFLGALGKTVSYSTIKNYRNRDIAANILFALGIDPPEFSKDGFSGQVLPELFCGANIAPYQDVEQN